ncbi:MAG: serine hydrolase, partial [Pseudomonadota bacterium]|nr:serine hydrolase [Pseudomonadota bacterium]
MHSLARRALHTCNVPRDLNPVTFRDTAGEHPDRVGLDSNAAEAVWRSVEALYRTGVHPGIQLSLRYRGEQVLHRSIGHARGNGPHDPASLPRIPMTTDTPICFFSASKAVTA